VAEIASDPREQEKVRLWQAANDLEPRRPMVFADPQGAWPELEAAWLELQCTDPGLHWMEGELRRRLLRHEHIPDDYPIVDLFDVPIPVTGDRYEDYGLAPRAEASPEPRGAYRIQAVIQREEDAARLRPRPIRLDPQAGQRTAELAHDLFGDQLRVRVVGKTAWRYGLTRVLVHWLGLEQMLLDLYDRPGLVHRLMAFLRDDFLAEIELLERERAISLNNQPHYICGTGGLMPTADLPAAGYQGTPRAADCICWGESQETVGVGPALFGEFVLQYQLPLLRRFGLVAYGCCEPLDHILDLLLENVPNLRWVAVSPWANRERLAERLGGRYVYVYKPNPSLICSPQPDWEGAEREIAGTLAIARGCPLHIVMKDTHTLCNEPERITRWADMARRLAEESL